MKVESKARVAFQGARGAFSEEAAIKLLGDDIVLVPRGTFEAMFSAIDEGAADYILAPIENSLAGSVHRSFDLLVDSKLNIIGEEIIHIAHNLIAPPGSTFEQLTVVESHPVALAQCEKFFSQNPKLKRIAAEDTAGSVRDVLQAGDRTRAAIAGRRAAEIYGGVILRENLQDNSENYTRFILLSPSQAVPENADKIVARVSARSSSARFIAGARTVCATRYQFDEDRKPARSRASMAVSILSRPAGFAARSGSCRGARRACKARRRIADSGKLCRRETSERRADPNGVNP